MVKRVLTPVLLAVIAGLMPQSLDAQISPTYIQFDPYTVKGALYRPREERMRNVAVRAPFPDDNVFLIVRASGARLVDASTHADSSTAQPRKHLKDNEKVATEVVRPVRPRTTTATQAALNSQFEGGARLLTLKSFLTANAIRSTNAMTGIDWCATHNIEPCTECEAQKGQYNYATRNFFNYVSRWISSRF